MEPTNEGNQIDFGEVMHRFYAGRQYGVRGPNYEDITWSEPVPMPTKGELMLKWEEIKEEILLRKVHQMRSAPGNYPSRDDMIVALWEMIVENRPEFAERLQERRNEIKSQYPKSE